MSYRIKSYGNRSEVQNEDGKVVYVGSDEGCQDYCDVNETVAYNKDGKPVTRAILQRYFEMVEDADNWKNPIMAKFEILSDKAKELISMAITFYTGSEAKWSTDGKFQTVTADGYYLTTGA